MSMSIIVILQTQQLHLVVDFSEGGSHLIGESSGHDDDVCLPGRGSEHDAVPGDREDTSDLVQ